MGKMQIQFNTDKNVTGSEALIASSTSLISEELSRYSRQITRVEVHFSDEDGTKEGFNDKRCMVEARLAGLKPIGQSGHDGATFSLHSDALARERLQAKVPSLVEMGEIFGVR